ncbi:MAG: metallophosphoesterase [Bacteroidales bacterium]|nr:metallophosphoesterase [Bacteroidales bacterium]
MKKTTFLLMALALTGFCNTISAQQREQDSNDKCLRFISFPDFFNFDIPHPCPGYDSAVNYFLNQVVLEDPDFVLVAGDLVNGHWWDSPACVKHMGSIYYQAWLRRMHEHKFRFYTAVGDHELGDDPWPKSKIQLIPFLEKAYCENLNMPLNGPVNKKGLAYFVREGDLLVITVETFEVIDDSMHLDVTGEQLQWFRKVLDDNADAVFKIVQGHIPVWGENKSRSSSRLMLEKGKESEFYRVMVEHDIDLYLAGEFHDVTVLESDGIWQIVHGSSWGREIVNTEDYLKGEIAGYDLNLTMKRIYMDATGEYMWNLNKKKGPREAVTVNEKTLKDGPEITGTLTIRKTGGDKQFINRTGVFQ